MQQVRRFIQDVSGAISPLMLVLFIATLLITGIALDLLRHEGARTDLQAALDRGVLAAASLTQTGDVAAIVESYVESGVSFSDEVSININPIVTPDGREIIATATYDSDSVFMSLIGYPTLIVPAAATAVEERSIIEISLVLDNSGSMRPTSKIGTLKTASTEFLNIIENGYSDGRAVVNLIPFSDNVDVRADVFDFLGVVRTTNDGNCAVFVPAEFDHTGVPLQGHAFQREHDWCERENVRIEYLSNNFNALRTRIDDMEAVGYTNTYTAMKWAVALVDPAIRTDAVFNNTDPTVLEGVPQITFMEWLIAKEIVASQYADRPRAWDDPRAQKVIIVMTDGAINPQRDKRGNRVMSHADAEAHFDRQCDLAKANDVLVYTIAFEASATARNQMSDCASSANTFFDVSGADLVSAFRQIAEQITTLKLTN